MVVIVGILIALYVLGANSVNVPTPCFVAAWVLFGVKLVAGILQFIFQLYQESSHKR